MEKPNEAVTLNSMEHCLSKITEAFRGLGEKEREQIIPFYELFLSNNEKITALASQCWAYFYKPYYKCGAELQYPAPCKWEILIPMKQANKGAILYALVPTGAKAGDKVVALYHYFLDAPLLQSKEAKPLDVSRFAKKLKSFDDPIQIDLPANKLAQVSDFMSAHGEELEGLGGKSALTGYNVVKLIDEPCIRFPCYNIALQCAQQMAYDDMGLRTYRMEDIWDYMVKNNLTEVAIRRTPPDVDVFQAMISWSLFEMLGLKPKERMLWVLTVFKKKDRRGKASQADGLYKKVTRYFKSYLARQKATQLD